MFCFFFNDTATTEIYTLSLHDALPICRLGGAAVGRRDRAGQRLPRDQGAAAAPDAGAAAEARAARQRHGHFPDGDRKSTRLNSSHSSISYAVFCLKKKNK